MSQRRSFIYFASPLDGGPIKIGCSQAPKDRLVSLMALVPYPLELLAFAPGTPNDERKLHSVFLASHLRSEWFRPSVEMWALIGRIRETGVLPDEMRGADKQPNPLHVASNVNSIRHTPEWRAKISAIHKARWAKEKAHQAFTAKVARFLSETALTADAINGHPTFANLKWKPIHVRQDGSIYLTSYDHDVLEAIMAAHGQKVAA